MIARLAFLIAIPTELLWLGWAMKAFIAAFPLWMAITVTAAHLLVMLGTAALIDKRQRPPAG